MTGVRQREAWGRNELPPLEEVRPGLWSVPLAFPHSPLRYTLCYLAVADSGVLVVDAGWDSREGRAALTGALETIGARLEDVVGVVSTHVHPDHHLLSSWLRRKSGAWVALHRGDADWIRASPPEPPPPTGLRLWGVPAEVIEGLGISEGAWRVWLSLTLPDRELEGGELFEHGDHRLRVVHTPGHTPGHVCLHDERAGVLLTGDHVLPRISPNISSDPEVDEDALGDYLRSLAKVGSLEDDPEVLPAHEYRFRGLADRTDFLAAHHEDRCIEVEKTLETGPLTVWELAQRLTWSRGWDALDGFLRRAALGETWAHVVHLRGAARVTVSGDTPALVSLPG